MASEQGWTKERAVEARAEYLAALVLTREAGTCGGLAGVAKKHLPAALDEIERLQHDLVDCDRRFQEARTDADMAEQRVRHAHDAANGLYRAAMVMLAAEATAGVGDRVCLAVNRRDLDALRAAISPTEADACAREAARRDALDARVAELLEEVNECTNLISDMQRERDRLTAQVRRLTADYQGAERERDEARGDNTRARVFIAAIGGETGADPSTLIARFEAWERLREASAAFASIPVEFDGGMRPNCPPDLAGCPVSALRAIQRMIAPAPLGEDEARLQTATDRAIDAWVRYLDAQDKQFKSGSLEDAREVLIMKGAAHDTARDIDDACRRIALASRGAIPPEVRAADPHAEALAEIIAANERDGVITEWHPERRPEMAVTTGEDMSAATPADNAAHVRVIAGMSKRGGGK
jgi:hypothetical protein